MKAEIFDVVDKQDRVVGQATRADVHRRGLYHRAIHVLLWHQDRVFLQRRSYTKDSAPGCWDSSCSGHVDSGESYQTSLWRELEEELGISSKISLWPVFKLPASKVTGWEFLWVYQGLSPGPFTLHREEIIDGRWFNPAAVDRLIATEPDTLAASFREIWGKM